MTDDETFNSTTGADEALLDSDQLELLRLLADGLSNDAAARRLNISERTVRRRSQAICLRLNVPAIITAVRWAAHRHML